MVSVAGTRYARALVDVVTAPGSGIDGARVLGELQAIQALVAESSGLRNALLSPAVSPSRKRAVMARLIAPGGTKQVRNFLFVVIDHRRIHEFSSIVEAFSVLLDERMGFVQGAVSSAHALTEAQQASLAVQISRLAGKEAKLKFNTDASLLGGVIARVGSTVYDGSVRGQLERLKRVVGSG